MIYKISLFILSAILATSVMGSLTKEQRIGYIQADRLSVIEQKIEKAQKHHAESPQIFARPYYVDMTFVPSVIGNASENLSCRLS